MVEVPGLIKEQIRQAMEAMTQELGQMASGVAETRIR